MYTNYKNTI